ncbi:glycosyltransferase 87 family protein [Saccharothrix obliqua]|uniref:glycosyltransferase 87 family protein n=1 Tax=Saccharothrix obliqua TaxID=2861747 RepID=UPI001C5F878F|nr:glycosyltransferase 87 family protein [Saccharothrix obliqua]MBW4720648.1 DUF2029 domain-containing protein [Saccharothrix obliqua]
MADLTARVTGSRFGPLAVLAAVAAVLTGQSQLLWSAIPYWLTDYDVYVGAGDTLVAGMRLYDATFVTAFPNMKYIYTPFASLLFVPFAIVPATVGKIAWTFLSLLALGGALWIALRLAGITSRRRLTALSAAALAAATFLAPVQHNLLLGQINTFLVLLVLVDFAPGVPERWRGYATGVAAGIKLTPLIFVPYLLLTGRTRAGLQAIAGFAATVAVGFLVLPADSTEYWLRGVFFDSSRMVQSDTFVNHSLPGLFGRLQGTVVAPHWSLAVAAVVGVAGLAAAVWAKRAGHDVVGVLVVAFTGLLVSPVSWMTHAVWVAPALAWLAFAKWRTASAWPKVVLAVAVAWYVMPFWSLGMRVTGSGVPVQLTPWGDLLVTLTGNVVPAVVAIALLPRWLKHLRPQGESSPAPTAREAGVTSATL